MLGLALVVMISVGDTAGFFSVPGICSAALLIGRNSSFLMEAFGLVCTLLPLLLNTVPARSLSPGWMLGALLGLAAALLVMADIDKTGECTLQLPDYS